MVLRCFAASPCRWSRSYARRSCSLGSDDQNLLGDAPPISWRCTPPRTARHRYRARHADGEGRPTNDPCPPGRPTKSVSARVKSSSVSTPSSREASRGEVARRSRSGERHTNNGTSAALVAVTGLVKRLHITVTTASLSMSPALIEDLVQPLRVGFNDAQLRRRPTEDPPSAWRSSPTHWPAPVSDDGLIARAGGRARDHREPISEQTDV